MKFVQRFAAAFAAVVTAMTFLVFPSSAAKVLEWDGKAELVSGNKYIVSSDLRVRNDFVIPEDAKIIVKDGASMVIGLNVRAQIYGELSAAIGGSITNSGDIVVEEGGQLNAYGEFLSSVSATLKIKGAFSVYNRGSSKISSAVSLFKTGSIYNKGRVVFTKSSDSKFSAPITITSKGEMHFQGNAAVTVSGSVDCSGYMTVGKVGTLKISGSVTLQRKADYNRFGTVETTVSGTFTDKRDGTNYRKYTVESIVDEADVTLRGVDVSYAQGNINWEKVAASGIDFAIIRAGRGQAGSKPMKEDDYFARNIQGAQANGIDVGVYFYSYATSVEEAKAEAKFFVSIIQNYEITYPVILDMEEEMQSGLSKDQLTDMIDAFFKQVMRAGYYPMLYSYKSWIESNLDMRILDKYAVWLAQISSAPSYDGAFYMWQYSYKGKVSGISGTVDMDIAYRDFPSIFRRKGINNL